MSKSTQAKQGKDGLYEVHIEFSESKHLASIIGVQQKDIMKAVIEDNNERKVTEEQADYEEDN